MRSVSGEAASRLGLLGAVFGFALGVGLTGPLGMPEIMGVSSLPAWADPANGPPIRLVAAARDDDARPVSAGAVRRGAGDEDHDRAAIHRYFADAQRGECLPGLVRTPDGCLPPGHNRAWHVGERLPPGLAAYELPTELSGQLTPPPRGYRYVRVGADILMIAGGSRMVASAFEDAEKR